MRPADLKRDVLPALILGRTRRQPDYGGLTGSMMPRDDRAAGLTATALLAQALRLERPPAPMDYTVDDPVSSRRALLPEGARAPFLRLFGGGKGALPTQDPLAAALAAALERLSLAPHPFDFHRLEPFLRAHADRLGPVVAAWLDREAASDGRSGFLDSTELTDDDWTLAAPARRERYVRLRRATDPAAGRALVEAVWASEKAEMRLRLLRAFGARITEDDRPFLAGIAGDRAPTVRELAAHLLAMLDGRIDGGPALKAVLDRIKRERPGLLRRRTTLAIERPANIPARDGLRWIEAAFATVDLAALLKALHLEADQAIEVAGDDELMLAAFATMAVRARRFDVLARISRLSTVPLLLLSGGGFAGDADFGTDEASDFAAAVFSSAPDLRADAVGAALLRFHALTEAPVPAETFAVILGTATRLLADDEAAVSSLLLTSLAIVAPASQRPAVRSLATGSSERGSPIVVWLDLLDRLEKGIQP